MAKKLQDDEIRWILSMDASGIQKEIGITSNNTKELTKANTNLKAEINEVNKQIRQAEKEMVRLTKVGKENSKEYKAVESVYNEAKIELRDYTAQMELNSRQIDANNAKINQLIRTMKVEDMTMGQLKKRAKELSAQLDSTSKAADPQTYNKLEKELNQVTNRMGELRNRGKEVEGAFTVMKGAFSVIIGNVGSKFLNFLSNGIRKIKDFGIEGKEMAAKTEGITTAFNKLNQPDLLKNLRKETKGLVSDLNLMKTTVKADTFKIPIDNLGSLLKFAQQRAQETGDSVDYLVESIVNGIGRKSSLILDNLGISASRLQDKVKETGDFTSAAIEIVNEELEKQGDLALTAADKETQAAIKWENAQLRVGKRLLWLGNLWNEISGNIADSISGIAGDARSAFEIFEDQIEKVADLEVNMIPLVERYEELSKKVGLNKDEQAELNRIIKSISTNIPGVITEFDRYGNVIAINTDRVYDYIEAEKARLQYVNKEAIENTEADIKKFENIITQAKNRRDNADAFKGYGIGFVQDSKEKDEKVIAEYGELLAGAEDQLKRLTGNSLDNQVESQKELIRHRQQFNTANKKELDSWINDEKNANSEYLKLAKQIYNQRFGDEAKVTDTQKKELEKQASARQKIFDDTKILIDNETKLYNDRLKEHGLYGVKLEKLTQEQLQKRLKLDKEYQDKLTKITEDAENKRFTSVKKEAGLDGDSTKFTEEQNKALELLQSQHEFNIQKIKDDSAKTQKKNQENVNNDILQSLIKGGKAQIDTIQIIEDTKIAEQKQKLADGLINITQYNGEVRKIESEALADRLTAQEQYRDSLKALTDPTEEQLQALTSAESAVLQTQNEINDRKVDQEIDFQERRKAVRQQYGLISLSEEYALELEQLKLSHEENLISEKEFEQAKLQLRLQYAGEYINKFQEMVQLASNFVSSIQEAETQKVKAEYAAQEAVLNEQLKNRVISQQEFNEKKGQLDYEARSAELELNKKYADAQFHIRVAEINANVASGIVAAWASAMELGIPAGPIVGGIMTGVLVGIGVAQVAAANKEREIVKNTTLAGPSSSTSSVTGNVVLTDSFDEGGYHPDGGYTGSGGKYEVAGHLPDGSTYHKGEYFVAQEEMSNPQVVPMVRAIDSIRAKRVGRYSLPGSYAEGGYHEAQNRMENSEQEIHESIYIFSDAVDKFASINPEVIINITDFKNATLRYDNSQNLAKRK